MRLELLSVALFIVFRCSYSQWSTSPYTQDALYVCPGFYPGLVTFDDGSCIVLGILESYIFAQKLDLAGYKMWEQPVIVHHNDSSQMSIPMPSEMTWFCSDGDGGVIMFWHDYRGAYLVCGEPYCEYKNNTTYLQRVDKNGIKQWSEEGVRVSGLENGFKQARITSDRSGGCVILLSEVGFDYPNAPNINYLKIARYNADGEIMWQTVLDSSFTIESKFQLYDINKGGEYYYFNFLRYPTNYGRSIKETGEIGSYLQLSSFGYAVPENKNSVFSYSFNTNTHSAIVTKIGCQRDTLWSKELILENFCPERATQLLPDSKGGVFVVHICQDSIIYFDSLGNIIFKKFEGIDIGGKVYNEGNNGLLVATATTAKRFDSSGTMIWPNEVTYLSDEGNAYHRYYKSDNNGGLLVSFWTVAGGIKAQHTGRIGKIGIITRVNDDLENVPINYCLYQNYPNPFNSLTTIKFYIKTKSFVRISITDILGRSVATFVNKEMDTGVYQIRWDANNYSSGIYFYSLFINSNMVSTKKLLLTK